MYRRFRGRGVGPVLWSPRHPVYHRLVSRSIMVVLSSFALCLGACGHTVLDQPVPREGDGWTLVVRKLTDGPNGIDQGNVVLKPKKGDRFIWVSLTLRNDQRQPRKFNFDRCDLDTGTKAIVPGVVTHDMMIGYPSDMNREPELAPGESIDRRLIFPYPGGQSPTRLTCAPMVFPLPQF
jgi:hypothetical protein